MKRIPYIISLACCLALTSTTHGQTATDTEATFELGRQMVQNRQFKKAAALLDSIAQLNISPDYKGKVSGNKRNTAARQSAQHT